MIVKEIRNQMSRIMVLNDNATFTALNGCRMVEVDDKLDTDEIEKCLEEIRAGETRSKNFHIIGEFDSIGIFKLTVHTPKSLNEPIED